MTQSKLKKCFNTKIKLQNRIVTPMVARIGRKADRLARLGLAVVCLGLVAALASVVGGEDCICLEPRAELPMPDDQAIGITGDGSGIAHF